MSSTLPPSVSINDIPGNRREDIEWESFMDMAEEKLSQLTLDEAKRAVLIGIAAVNAERNAIRQLLKLQDRDTRHSWAEAVLKCKDGNEAHSACMNARSV